MFTGGHLFFRGFIWTHGADDAMVGGSNLTGTGTGTTITLSESSHGLRTGFRIPVPSSSSLSAVPPGISTITRIDNNSFSFQGNDFGAIFGNVSYSAGSTYKQNLTNLLNGTIDYLTSSIKNLITGNIGYTENKLRIFIPEIRSGAAVFDANFYNSILSGQRSIGTSFLSENPIRASNVIGTISQSTDDLSMLDPLHYSTGADGTLAQREANYFIQFVNE